MYDALNMSQRVPVIDPRLLVLTLFQLMAIELLSLPFTSKFMLIVLHGTWRKGS